MTRTALMHMTRVGSGTSDSTQGDLLPRPTNQVSSVSSFVTVLIIKPSAACNNQELLAIEFIAFETLYVGGFIIFF